MSALILNLPDNARDFALARDTLRRKDATREQLEAACDVLSASQAWTDIVLVRDLRNAMFADRHSELQPSARQIAARLADMNRPQMARDRRHAVTRYAAKVALAVTAIAGLALISSALWADTTARTAATLEQARCGDVCIFLMEE